MTDLSLTVERTIRAAQEDVFNAWLSPDMLRRFMTPGPAISVPVATCDPQVGGRFEIVMKAESGEISHAGTYHEIVPHERIVFTWESPFSVDDSIVTITFATVDGGTHITLTQVRFENEEMRDNHRGGWTQILASLDEALGAAAA